MFVFTFHEQRHIEVLFGNVNTDCYLKYGLTAPKREIIKYPIESIQKPHAKSSLIHTGSKPQYTVRTIYALRVRFRVWMAGSSICGTGFKPFMPLRVQGTRDFLRYPPDDQPGILALWGVRIKI